MEFETVVARRNGNMRMSEFELLPGGEQIEILYNHGVYVGKSKTGKLARLLFQLDTFYVEIEYISYRLAIRRIYCTECTAILDPYLEQIEVEYLVT